MSEEWTLERLRETARGYRMPLIILTLVRAGVFDELAVRPATAETLAASCGVDREAVTRLLNVLVSAGLLGRDADGYFLAGALADKLVPGQMGSAMDGLRHTADGLDKWFGIEEALKAGHAEYPDRLDVIRDPERNIRFIRAMHTHAAPVAGRFADLADAGDARTFLDVGGGPGTFALAMVRRWPDLQATVADLPLTLRVTRQVIREDRLQERVSLTEADFYGDEHCNLGGPWDLVLVSAVIHSEGPEQNRKLFGRIRRTLADGGRIVVRETILDEDRLGPPRAAMFDAHMLVSTRRGRCYTQSEISHMLLDAGFVSPRRLGEPDDGFVQAYASPDA